MAYPMDIVAELEALIGRGCLAGSELYIIQATIEIMKRLKGPPVTRSDFDRIFDETESNVTKEQRDEMWARQEHYYNLPGAKTIDQVVASINRQKKRMIRPKVIAA